MANYANQLTIKLDLDKTLYQGGDNYGEMYTKRVYWKYKKAAMKKLTGNGYKLWDYLYSWAGANSFDFSPKKITDEIFVKVVGIDESAFSRELYMSLDQIKCMVDCGMHIGSHGYDHYWLSSLPKEKQEYEIAKSIEFIDMVGGDYKNWTICYPYGDYNQDTIDLLKQHGCKMGLCTKVDVATLGSDIPDSIFKLPRLDVNDLPKDANAAPNEWYESA